MQIRRLAVSDLPASRTLGGEAFGEWPERVPRPPLPTELPPGRFEWGAFDAGTLAARVVTHSYETWWAGARVATAGVAGVAVAAEHRGAGLLRPLFEAALGEALARGEVVSTLYPTAPGIYRGLGYEVITSYDTVELPTAELTRIAAPPGVSTRRATPDDLPAVFATYDAWAAAQRGPLTRDGDLFDDRDRLLEEVTGVSLAVSDDGRVLGFLTWDRGSGYGPEATLTVHDLLATSLDAYRALWRLAGSFASVTGRVRISTSGADPARLALPAMTWSVVSRHPYMFRVLDLPGAVTAMTPTLPAGARIDVELRVTGDRLGLVDGGFRLSLGDAAATCEPADVGSDAVTLTVQGLSLLVAGAQSCANLRLLGLLTGPEVGDRALDAAFGRGQPHVRDYF